MSAFARFMFGSPEKTQTFSQFSPQQLQFMNSIMSQAGGPLGQAFGNIGNILSGSPEAFKGFEAPAMRQFQEEILPNLAAGFGGLGAQSSSGAQQTFARAGERLSENLAAQRANLQQGAIQNLMGLINPAMQGTQQTAIRPETFGFLGNVGSGLGSGLGMALGGGMPAGFAALMKILQGFAQPKQQGVG